MEAERDPDPDWVAGLSGRSASAARTALSEAMEDRRLFRHLAREHAQDGRVSYGEIDAPFELYALTRLIRPRHVLEVGVASGVSSAYLLAALERNGSGTLHSIDRPKRTSARQARRRPPRSSWSLPPGRSSGWAVPFTLRKRWDLRLGDKAVVLPLLEEELPRVELFVYDVPHEDSAALREFRGLDRLLPSGGVAIVDHGPGGGLCPSLGRWAKERGSLPMHRRGTGLFGMRCAHGPERGEARRPRAGGVSDQAQGCRS